MSTILDSPVKAWRWWQGFVTQVPVRDLALPLGLLWTILLLVKVVSHG